MKKIDLTSGNELSVISLLSLPLIGSSLLQFLYNFIDMIFVGGLGPDAIAAVGSASFFINLGYAVQAMIVVGGGIKIAHSVGRKNDAESASYIGSSLLLNLFIGIITVFGLLLFGNRLLDLLNLNNDAVQIDAYKYLAVSAFMLFFSYFNTFFIRMFSSFGNNKQSFYISAFGLILNIILDPIFIYTFKWGVIGAAIATLISHILMFILFIYLARSILFKKNIFQIRFQQFKEIIGLGIPMSIQRILFTVINIILAIMIASYGTDAVAAQKIGLQIESITFIVMGSLNGAVGSFIGQNFGAKKYKRILKGYRVSLLLGISYALITSIIFIFFSEELAGIFTRDPETIAITSAYLTIIGLSQIFMAIEIICMGAYTGIGMPKIPSTISVIFTLMRIPLAILLIPSLGLAGIWWSIAISSFVKGIVSVLIFNTIYRRKYQHAI
ncbi:multidrug transporter MatE [Bacillus sp. FJAT-27916]|uniref:MATE family efflux transporter n=1 Tax=Bacillus sp. FJAT-27916 TaxID=1679169 RepID=UPI0006715A65|nr:MATE family efflux transporter [Bacillus sp. FJAT-27916]KMY45550.1 multidrug transporter MatE [Bacillus sp. FJAT-27916]